MDNHHDHHDMWRPPGLAAENTGFRVAYGSDWINTEEPAESAELLHEQGAEQWCVPVVDASTSAAETYMLDVLSAPSPTAVDCGVPLLLGPCDIMTPGFGPLPIFDPAGVLKMSTQNIAITSHADAIHTVQFGQEDKKKNDQWCFQTLPTDTPTPTTLMPTPTTSSSRSVVPIEDVREEQRRRQRGYERKYRQKKQEDLRSFRRMWVKLELQLHHVMAARARGCTVVNSAATATLPTRYLDLLREERALQYDTVVLRTMRAWRLAFVLRNYNYDDDDIPRTQERWEAMDHGILGASITKPFVPNTFQFDW